ncbi:f-box domain-containing protein [Trichonephila inaurata madagascariensis]|uniref:F-box domain-containing protein n=1 Tax=Trichonephila inaurata madagascariensis TaxID=2747483 RepID=A0A8X6XR37_9ARAC|nr:f-box domain-containing protein [Trichonephila inaurata madagascariensis]
MTRDISSLPPEDVMGILKFLDVPSRLKASLVCKMWFQIINCPQLLCDVKIQFSGEVDEAIKRFSRMTRKFQWFSFIAVKISNPVVEFLKKYSSQFVILSFSDCKVIDGIFKHTLQDKILHCDNLLTLNILNSDITFLFAPLLNLTELNLRLKFTLSDYVISEFSKSLSKLEKLSLGDGVVMEEEAYKRFFFTEVEPTPSYNMLTFVFIKMLIEKNRFTLRCIDFTNLQLAADHVITISKIQGLKLTKILFPYKLNSIYVERFCENQLSLVAVDFSTLTHVEDNIVSAVIKCLQNLQEFIIFNMQTIDKCITEIFQLQNLVKLDLSYCFYISQLSYNKAVSGLKTFKLKSLNLAFAKISDDNLFKLLKCNKNIRYLNVSGTCISNKTLNMICNNLILLECLILSSCREISDSGLTGEFESYSDTLTPTRLSNLKYITQLNLNKNSITNKGCIKAIRFPKLKTLFLNKCRRLILNQEFIMELKKQNPYLQDFNPS